mmetsp:Transcript_57460/g.91394  ORF Transcript_57460/g.91394 Transcript_57460/m.91394 type:complete len:272 (+) Transcript_57460:98-913(+)
MLLNDLLAVRNGVHNIPGRVLSNHIVVLKLSNVLLKLERIRTTHGVLAQSVPLRMRQANAVIVLQLRLRQNLNYIAVLVGERRHNVLQSVIARLVAVLHLNGSLALKLHLVHIVLVRAHFVVDPMEHGQIVSVPQQQTVQMVHARHHMNVLAVRQYTQNALALLFAQRLSSDIVQHQIVILVFQCIVVCIFRIFAFQIMHDIHRSLNGILVGFECVLLCSLRFVAVNNHCAQTVEYVLDAHVFEVAVDRDHNAFVVVTQIQFAKVFEHLLL